MKPPDEEMPHMSKCTLFFKVHCCLKFINLVFANKMKLIFLYEIDIRAFGKKFRSNRNTPIGVELTVMQGNRYSIHGQMCDHSY